MLDILWLEDRPSAWLSVESSFTPMLSQNWHHLMSVGSMAIHSCMLAFQHQLHIRTNLIVEFIANISV